MVIRAHFRQLFVVATAVLMPVAAAQAQSTAFTYQGSLKNGGSPATGNYDLTFKIFDALSAGTQIGSTITLNAVSVAGGLFTVQLDFGASPFAGARRWLEIAVNGTTLAPRQELTASPYALFSAAPWSASGANLSFTTGNVGIGDSTPVAA